MSRSNDAGHFFQTTEALATTERKAAKAKNKYGDPLKFPSKILALLNDPSNEGTIYVAEAAGEVKKVVLEVCKKSFEIYDLCERPTNVLLRPAKRPVK